MTRKLSNEEASRILSEADVGLLCFGSCASCHAHAALGREPLWPSEIGSTITLKELDPEWWAISDAVKKSFPKQYEKRCLETQPDSAEVALRTLRRAKLL